MMRWRSSDSQTFDGDGPVPPGRPVPGKWRAAVLYAALTIVLMYPISVRPGSVLPADDPDAHLGLWMLSWDVRAFTHQPFSIFEGNTFYPHHRTLAYQDSLIGSALLVAPLLWLTGNPVLAFNGVSLFASVLCGLGAFMLARRVGLSERSALICGLIFAFCPARFFRFPQIGLSPVQWIPLTLASLHAYFDGGHKRDLRFALAFFTMQVLASGHGAVFLVVAVVMFLAYRIVLGEPIQPLRRLRDVGLVGAGFIVLMGLVYLPYWLNQREVGLRRGLGSWWNPWESFFASPTHVHTFILSLFDLSWINENAGGFLFAGYLPMLLALVAAVVAFRRLGGRPPERRKFRLLPELLLSVCLAVSCLLTVRFLVNHAATRPLDIYGLAWPWLTCGALAAAVVWRARTDPDRPARSLRPLVVILIASLALGGLALARANLPAGDGLSARYYANTTFADPAAFSSVDPRPSTEIVRDRVGATDRQDFAVRWAGYLLVPEDGVYEFSTTSDDGSRLLIDGFLVVDNSGKHSPITATGSRHLTAGSHRVLLEFTQFSGGYSLEWSWGREGSAPDAVPTWALSQRRARYATAVAARIIDWLARLVTALAIAGAGWWIVAGLPTAWREWQTQVATARRSPVPFYIALTILCFLLAVGPPYGIWQFVYTWPGFSFIRAPLRFMILGALGIAVLAAFGFDRLTARLSPSRRRLAAVVVAVILLVEFAAMPVVSVPFAVEIPAADRWVAAQPKPFVVAEVPVHGNEREQTLYMLHSTAHWQKTVAGYGGIRPALSQTLNWQLMTFPHDEVLGSLAQLGVKFVVVHVDLYEPGEWPAVEQRLKSYEGSWLRLEYSDPAARVYSVISVANGSGVQQMR